MSMERRGGIILTGETEELGEKTCPSATLSTTNPTWADPGANPGLRGERPATNRLSHLTAVSYVNAHHICRNISVLVWCLYSWTPT
jgi:hypothetical protein